MLRNDRVCLSVLLGLILASGNLAFSQQRTDRTLDEIKTEAVYRAENGVYPLIGLDAADVKEAFASIHTKDKDEWAAGFMGVADRYMNEAKSLEKTDPTKANADYIRAWRLYSFGRWPFPHPRESSAPMKRRSRPSWLTRGSGTRRWKSFTSPSMAKKSSATCACRRMPRDPSRW